MPIQYDPEYEMRRALGLEVPERAPVERGVPGGEGAPMQFETMNAGQLTDAMKQAQAGRGFRWRQHLPQLVQAGMLGMAGGSGGSMWGAIPAAITAGLLAGMEQKKKPEGKKKGGMPTISRGQITKEVTGGRRFRRDGEESPIKSTPKMVKPPVPETPAKAAAKAKAAPRFTRTGRFAKGGLVRGAGAAIRGTHTKGDC